MPPAFAFLIFGAVVTVIVVGALKVFAADRLVALTARLKQSSRIVSRGELVGDRRRQNVLLALTDSAFIYESTDGQSSFDRQWIQEVGY
jgi:hypothetical protein